MGGGGLMGNTGGGLLGNMGGGGLMGNTGGGLLGNMGGGGLMGNTGGGLLGNMGGSLLGNTGGGLLGNRQAGLLGQQGGSLLTPNMAGGLGMGNQMMGYGMPYYQPNVQQKAPKFTLLLTNQNKSKAVSSMQDDVKKFIEAYTLQLAENDKNLKLQKEENKVLGDLESRIKIQLFTCSQNAKLIYLKLRQAKGLVDTMRGDYEAFSYIANNFETQRQLIITGRVPKVEIPSSFICDITNYFAQQLNTLKTKIFEIEEILEKPGIGEDSDEYEKIIMIMDEFYHYYLDVASKVLSMHEYIENLKNRFINIFKTYGNRDVDKFFEEGHKEIMKVDILKGLDNISTAVEPYLPKP
jgi:hypothetical protein